jgi:hypothetical protein
MNISHVKVSTFTQINSAEGLPASSDILLSIQTVNSISQ